jgi:hypothetical protein
LGSSAGEGKTEVPKEENDVYIFEKAVHQAWHIE